MAQSKKRASARRGKVARRSKAPTRATAKKTAKRSVKAKPKKTALRPKAKRAVGKQLAPSKVKPPQKRTEPPIEVIRVETVDEPAPGTVVVTEYVEARVPAGGASAQKGKQTSLDLPDPEDD